MNQKTQEALDKLPVTDQKITPAPAYTNETDPLDVLRGIDNYIEQLAANEHSPAAIYTIAENIKQWLQAKQILTFNKETSNKQWMTKPVQHVQETRSRGLLKRIGHLFETGGEWLSGNMQHEHIEVRGLYVNACITTEPSDNHHRIIQASDIDIPAVRITAKIKALHEIIMQNIRNDGSSGIFNQPYGVSTRNETIAWFQHEHIAGYQNIHEAMQVETLYDFVNQIDIPVEVMNDDMSGIT